MSDEEQASVSPEEQQPEQPTVEAVEEDLDELELELGLKKKKKKKKKKDKKKKKSKKKSSAEDVEGGAVDGASEEVVEGAVVVEEEGESPWDPTSARDYNYTELLDRVMGQLRLKNPNLHERKRHKMPPPKVSRVGTRKTMWSNFALICETMHRQPEHVMSFLLAELGTDGSVDGKKQLILKGRFPAKNIESLLKKYIVEYVTCHMCRSPETSLTRDSVTRLYFLDCEACGSRRSVAPVKSGFHATSRADRRKAKFKT